MSVKSEAQKRLDKLAAHYKAPKNIMRGDYKENMKALENFTGKTLEKMNIAPRGNTKKK